MGMRQGERLQRMIEQLLLAAKFEERPSRTLPAQPARVELDASELVRRAGEEAQARHRQRPITVFANGALPVLVTQDAVAQVLDNLVDNACKYSHEGQPVHLSGTRENGHAVLAVEDCGPGIDLADRERIFERFVRLEPSRSRDAGGTGLGLAISREIMTAHGGTVTIVDAPNGWCRFEIRLPAEPEERPE